MQFNSFARTLRRQSTEAEKKLWFHLRDRRFFEIKFRRQFSVGPYVVDFICYEHQLIIELDGGQHTEQRDYDARRSKYLINRGYRVVRFWNHDVLLDIDSVLEALWLELGSPSPQPLFPGRGA